MGSHFITNRGKIVADVLENILPVCDKLHFLVGYFYFSGFQEIYPKIKENDQHLRILVGLDAETRINNIIEYSKSSSSEVYSIQAIRNNVFETSVKVLSESSEYDNKESLEAFNLFISKIRNGTLEVRKTLDPSHAKMYLMELSNEHNQNGEALGVTILGSSNFSANGLKNNFEINIQNRDNDFFLEGKAIFEELWGRSVLLAAKDNISEIETKLIDRVWFNKIYSPFLVYLKVLIEYFAVRNSNDIRLPREILGKDFVNLKYQTDAILMALDIIKEHSGVIIADVVGLGKSIIATTVADNLSLPVIIVAPPHLIPQWEEYAAKLNTNSKVFSSGLISEAVKYSYLTPDKEKVVIVDEAHRYRSQDTQAYSDLETLCRGNKVIILSATPFNNRPQDIFSLIRLFQIPHKSTIRTVDNIAREFSKINEEYKRLQKEDNSNKCQNLDEKIKISERRSQIADKIKRIIGPVVIRRNRKDLLSYSPYKKDIELQGITFPEIQDPIPTKYSLGKLTNLYLDSLNKIAGDKDSFIAARYKPISYVKSEFRQKVYDYIGLPGGDPQANNAKFMRRLLVRRFESSVYSFKKSLDNILTSYNRILSFYNRNGLIIVSKSTDLSYFDEIDLSDFKMDTSDSELISKDLFDNDPTLFDISISGLTKEKEKEFAEREIYFIQQDHLDKSFIVDMEKDIALLTDLKNKWKPITEDKDPKLQCLKKILSEQVENDPNRKIILFSEFADTVDYLSENLKDNKLRIVNYKSGLGKSLKEEIRADFDANYSRSRRTNNFNILLATDALSEGVNLNRAGTIFNYDIPYNPTRVIQRVGRINRVNKKMFDKLFIYNYFPTEIGEIETNIQKISTSKMDMIGLILGEDTKYLTESEQIRESLFKFNADEEEASWDIKHMQVLEDVRNKNPQMIKEAMDIPQKARILRVEDRKIAGVLIFGKKGKICVFSLYDDVKKKSEIISDEKALDLFEAYEFENSRNVEDKFYDMYYNAKAIVFNKESGASADPSEQKTFAAIMLLKSVFGNDEYLLDLERVMKLGALCLTKQYKIKTTAKGLKVGVYDNKDIDKFQTLKQQIPYSYLKSVISQEVAISTQKDTIILAEQFNSGTTGEILI